MDIDFKYLAIGLGTFVHVFETYLRYEYNFKVSSKVMHLCIAFDST